MATTTHAIDTQTMASLPGMFFAQAARLEDRPFLWAKIDGVYRPRTWTTVHKQVVAAAHGLKAAGIKPGDRVMLVAENRPEWFIANMAIMTVGAIAVPAYTTNTALNHLHILNDSGSTAVIVSTPQLAKRVIAAASEANQKITAYVMDEPEKTIPSDVPTLPWSGLAAAGAEQAEPPEEANALQRDNVCALIYTSGTGGLPRGVMLTHGNILCNCMGATEHHRDTGHRRRSVPVVLTLVSRIRALRRTVLSAVAWRADLLCGAGRNANDQSDRGAPHGHDSRASPL